MLGDMGKGALARYAEPAAAPLPAAYEAARTALANCEALDECQSWADKAAALASYARQADDTTLEMQAKRIQARAVRRCGELLQDFKSAGGRPADNGGDEEKTRKDALTSSPASQRQAAADMSTSRPTTSPLAENSARSLFRSAN